MTLRHFYLFNQYTAAHPDVISPQRQKQHVEGVKLLKRVTYCNHRQLSSLKRTAPKKKAERTQSTLKCCLLTQFRCRKGKISKQAPNYTEVIWIMLPSIWSSCNEEKGIFIDVECVLLGKHLSALSLQQLIWTEKEEKDLKTPWMPNHHRHVWAQ